jgi:opacity protein-like surface antigen
MTPFLLGGAAFVQVRGSVIDNCQTVATGCGNWVVTTRDTSDTITTWTLGGGVEWAVVNNWSIKAEYMFIGLGDSHPLNTCGFAAAPVGNLVGGGQFCFNHEFAGIHTAKVGFELSVWSPTVVRPGRFSRIKVTAMPCDPEPYKSADFYHRVNSATR